ncbi:MAG TPA: hypothetical protein ENJ56_01625, partial [Anaerolineae bacterium]|nr:hypothetical protein [Anaerolineae bacterium]
MTLTRRSFLFAALFVFVSIIYWLLPIKGKLVYQNGQAAILTFPHITLTHEADSFTVLVRDPTPWTHVRLEVVGESAELIDFGTQDANGLWQWRWRLPASVQNEALRLYHSCADGCQAWGITQPTKPSTTNSPALIPSKLGIVLADPTRDWHGRQGWDVEITYAQLADEEFWGVDDLAQRVQLAQENGLRVLLRIEYGQGQSLPAADDTLALDAYLQFVQRIARDARLKNVYGFIIGSNFNTAGGNSQFPDALVTPAWYARIFNGYGVAASLNDNALAIIRRENQLVRVLAGPVNPWNVDQGGSFGFRPKVPWLDYMHAMVNFIDQGAAAKAAIGIAGMAPDGFAVQAFGRVNAGASELERGAREPLAEIFSAEYPHAQMGF